MWGLLILLLLLGGAVRLYQLDDKSLWYDELGTAMYTAPDRSLSEVLQEPLEVPVIPAPPLYFVTTYLFRQISESEFLLRLPSVFYGLLAIAAIYILGKALLGPWEGLVGAFLLTISTFHIRYSQEARYYSLLLLLTTLSLYFFYRGLRRNDKSSWIGYVVSSVLAVYTHHFAFLFLAVEGVFALVYLAMTFLRSGEAVTGERTRSWWKGEPFFSFLPSVLVVALLYLPMLPYTLGGLLSRKGLGGQIRTNVDKTTLSYLAGIVDLLGAGPGLARLCYLAALGLGLYLLARRARQQLVLAVLWITLPFLVVFLVPAGHNFRLRYVIPILPLFLLLVSAGLARLGQLISPLVTKRAGRRKATAAVMATTPAIGCLLFALFSMGALHGYWDEEKQPWDKAAAFLQGVTGAQQVVITTNEAHAHRLLYYGYDASQVEYLVPCPCPAQVTLGDWSKFSELASAYRQAWLLDPSPNLQSLQPGGALAEELESYIFLPPIIFKGHTRDSIVEADLLAPFMTSDIGVLPVLPRDSQPTDEGIVQLGSMLASRAEDLYPGATRLPFTLAELHRLYGSDRDAIAQYEAAIAHDPRFYPAYEGLAMIYVKHGRIQEAVNLYREMAQTGIIHESSYHFLQGSLHLAEGDLEASIAELTLAVRTDEDNVLYRLRLAQAYQGADRLEEAMAQYQEALRLEPSYAQTYAARASAYRAQGHLAEAVDDYRMAVRLLPGNAFYRALLADAYREQGLLVEALVHAQQAVLLREDVAPYHVLLGQIYQASDLLPEAIRELEEGVRLAPGVAPYYLDLANAYLLGGRNTEAVAAYERVLELDPGNVTAAQRLAELR